MRIPELCPEGRQPVYLFIPQPETTRRINIDPQEIANHADPAPDEGDDGGRLARSSAGLLLNSSVEIAMRYRFANQSHVSVKKHSGRKMINRFWDNCFELGFLFLSAGGSESG